VTTIAARPRNGKTAFALNLAVGWASEDIPRPGAIFSLEMTGEELMGRALISGTGGAVSQGDIDEIAGASPETAADILAELAGSAERMWALPILLDDRPGLSVAQIAAAVRRHLHKERLEWVVVDYGQLMQASNTRKGGSRAEDVSGIWRDLKVLAKTYGLHVVVLAQVSREAEREHPHRPSLAHLKESGGIEEHSDRVLSLHWPHAYGSHKEREASGVPDGEQWDGIVQVGILKQRSGVGTGGTMLMYGGGNYLFRALTEQEWQAWDAATGRERE
jgi:replicative DNA helicase